jgi:hypothetical protein
MKCICTAVLARDPRNDGGVRRAVMVVSSGAVHPFQSGEWTTCQDEVVVAGSRVTLAGSGTIEAASLLVRLR